MKCAKCGTILLNEYAEEGDLCLYCQRETEKLEKPDLKPSKPKRNQWHTGFFK